MESNHTLFRVSIVSVFSSMLVHILGYIIAKNFDAELLVTGCQYVSAGFLALYFITSTIDSVSDTENSVAGIVLDFIFSGIYRLIGVFTNSESVTMPVFENFGKMGSIILLAIGIFKILILIWKLVFSDNNSTIYYKDHESNNTYYYNNHNDDKW